MTRIFLIRHGETEWNKVKLLQGNSDVKLSPTGLHQAKLLADHAPLLHIDAIYSSDLSRAVMTAKVLSDRYDLPVTKMAAFRETNFGDWEGRPLRELAAEFPIEFGKFFIEPEKFTPPHGETFLECQARVVNAMDKIAQWHDNQNIVIVTHGAVIRLILCAALEIPIRKMWAIAQFNTAVNILRVDAGSVTVELVNGSDHLSNV